jgi:hypothetical protein
MAHRYVVFADRIRGFDEMEDARAFARANVSAIVCERLHTIASTRSQTPASTGIPSSRFSRVSVPLAAALANRAPAAVATQPDLDAVLYVALSGSVDVAQVFRSHAPPPGLAAMAAWAKTRHTRSVRERAPERRYTLVR